MLKDWTACLVVAAVSIAAGGTIVSAQGLQTAQAGETFRDCSDCPEMVVVPAGSFLMGSSAEETKRDLDVVVPAGERNLIQEFVLTEHPQHRVDIPRPFALGRYPVTREEFAAFVRETGYSPGAGCVLANRRFRVRAEAGWQNPEFSQTDRDPVVCVSWQDAKAYIAWLNGKLRGTAPIDGEGPYRLPSEAEWEYAARAGTQTARWWGDSPGRNNANCDGCGSRWDGQSTAPVGSFRPNPFGLSDMLGNIWQWTEDCWNESYIGAPGDGGAWNAGTCDFRVLRGGAWGSSPWFLRSASRTRNVEKHTNFQGFRIARALP